MPHFTPFLSTVHEWNAESSERSKDL